MVRPEALYSAVSDTHTFSESGAVLPDTQPASEDLDLAALIAQTYAALVEVDTSPHTADTPQKQPVIIETIAHQNTSNTAHTELSATVTTHLQKAAQRAEKLQRLAPRFGEVVGTITSSLSALGSVLKFAAAACPHCIVPVMQVASSVGSAGFGLPSFGGGGGHYHADGSWHAEEHKPTPMASNFSFGRKSSGTKQMSRPRSSPHAHATDTALHTGLSNATFGAVGSVIDMLFSAVLPQTQQQTG